MSPSDPNSDRTEPLFGQRAAMDAAHTELPTIVDPAGAPTRIAPAGPAPGAHERTPDSRERAPQPATQGDFGPYTTVELVASGPTGELHLARDVALDREAWLWVPDEDALAVGDRRERFLREARILAQTNHPHLAAVYAIERGRDDRIGLAFERLAGRTLARRVADGDLAPDDVRWPRYLGQAALGLQAACAAGVVHRDVAPAHLECTDSDQLVVSRFALGGITLPVADDPAAHAQRRAPELSLGAPEDEASDLYALGAAFCQSLDPGRSPARPIEPPGACAPRFASVLAALMRPRAERTRNYDALLDDLEPLLPGTLDRTSAWMRLGSLAFDYAMSFAIVLALGFAATMIAALVPMALGTDPAPRTRPLTDAERYALAGAGYAAFAAYYVLTLRRWGATVGLSVFRAEVHTTGSRALSTPRVLARFALSWGAFIVLLELAAEAWDVGGWIAGIAAGALAAANLALLRRPERRMLHDFATGTWVAHRTPERLDRHRTTDTAARVDHAELERARGTGMRIGRALVLGSLGRGGMGEVYRGYDETLDRHVAVKVLQDGLGAQPGFEERFLREARLLAGLSHPHVVQLYHYGLDGARPYFAMELVGGPSLAQHAEHHGPLDETQAVEWLIQAARGLDAARSRDIIHRDIKPSNMILTPSHVLKMVDFGMAKLKPTAGAGAGEDLTATGVVMGTPHYMSPEQGQGEDTDHRSDIYSLGASFYHLLTGQYPYTAKTPMGVVVKHITQPFPEEPLRGAVSRGLYLVVERMMAKDPAQRFQDYPALIGSLERLRPGVVIPAGFASRFAAGLIDLVVWGAFLIAFLGLGLALDSALDHRYGRAHADLLFARFLPALQLILVCPSVIVLARLLRCGDTPGLRAIGLEVTRPDGTPPPRRALFVWWLLDPATLWTVVGVAIYSGVGPDWMRTALYASLLAVPGINALGMLAAGRSPTELTTGTRLVYRRRA